MAKRISVINFKGGVGKTTLAFHLATGLERYHEARVLLIDIDHQSSLSILCLGAGRWRSAVNEGKIVNRVFQHRTVQGAQMPGSEIVVDSPIRRSPSFSTELYPSLDLIPASLELDDTEIQLTSSHTGAVDSEWTKRTLLCQWLEQSGLDTLYDYIIIDSPPATKIVSQNAIALSHGYIVPVVPEAVMERGAPHLVDLVREGIDDNLQLLSQIGTPRAMHVGSTQVVGFVITRIKTSRGDSGYTNDHTEHLDQLQRRWQRALVKPYIEDGVGVSESLTRGLPVYDLEHTRYGALTQNVGKRGFPEQFRALVGELKARFDRL